MFFWGLLVLPCPICSWPLALGTSQSGIIWESAGIFLHTDQGHLCRPSLLLPAVISRSCDWFTVEKEREEQVEGRFVSAPGGAGGGTGTNLEWNPAAEAGVPSALCFGCLWLQQTGLNRVVSSVMKGVRAGEEGSLCNWRQKDSEKQEELMWVSSLWSVWRWERSKPRLSALGEQEMWAQRWFGCYSRISFIIST